MKTFKSILSAAAILCSAAFVMSNSTGCSTEEVVSDDELVNEADQALTAEQCEYFDVNGTIQICHSLGNGKFKILKLNEQACVNAHGSHATDYVTSTDPASPLYDPTCQGNGCLPQDAPCDETLPCCDGSTCTNGVCAAAGPCSPNPCQNGGICSPVGSDDYSCQCVNDPPVYWGGKNCDVLSLH